MSLPFFYHPFQNNAGSELVLGEDSSRHIVQVLRMQPGEKLLLTNGLGSRLTVQLADAHKKHCRVIIESEVLDPPAERKLTLAVGMLKNASRLEWLLEKATEMGVAGIIPLDTERTIREKFRYDRMQSILISAMLQSQQSWLPRLWEPVSFKHIWQLEEIVQLKSRFIAHCAEGEKSSWFQQSANANGHCLLLIGPEGDFSEKEIEDSIAAGAQPVSLGQNRLRTETAAMAAVAAFYLAGNKQG